LASIQKDKHETNKGKEEKMINTIIASWVTEPLGLLIILFLVGVPVVLFILFVKYLIRSNKERERLRFEMDKLASELEQVRKQKEFNKKGDSFNKSR